MSFVVRRHSYYHLLPLYIWEDDDYYEDLYDDVNVGEDDDDYEGLRMRKNLESVPVNIDNDDKDIKENRKGPRFPFNTPQNTRSISLHRIKATPSSRVSNIPHNYRLPFSPVLQLNFRFLPSGITRFLLLPKTHFFILKKFLRSVQLGRFPCVITQKSFTFVFYSC
ncbi:hypothetical protein L6452_34901 [Arctium lappa]|uniref:Uncharacterized protein n=1 Tax=Arctium lappa TaxID=4217 RepID=A0ACB8YKL1_ARCLA|nr:hypothetical protein L6452_34901 [Arctium lappa]